MARRSEHSKDEIKAMALTAAKSLIEVEGLAGVSARKLANQIGYTVGSLYMVFDNLDDLIMQVNIETLDELYQQLEQSVNNIDTPQASLLALAHAYIDYALANSNRWNAIFEHHLPDGQKTPEWFQQRVEQIFTLVEQYTEKIKTNKAQAVKAARALWCGVHGICILYMTNKLHLPDQVQLQALAEDLVKNYLTGWLKGVRK